MAKIKFLSLIIVFIAAFLFASNGLQNFFDDKFKYKLNLGLDLVGGSSLTMEADFKQYIDDMNNVFVDDISRYAKENNLDLSGITNENGVILLKFDPKSLEKIKSTNMIERITGGQYKIAYENEGVTMRFNSSYINNMKSDAINEVIKNIQKRVDATGGKEIIIQKLGEERILLQAPGFKNSEELRYAVGKTAKLTFHIVDDSDSKSMNLSTKTLRDGSGREFNVFKKVELDGTAINHAYATSGKNGNVVVTFALDKIGTEKFAKITSENIGKQLAIVIDDEIMTAPVIREAINVGHVEISGNFSYNEAKNLASSLQAGALPVKLKIIEEKNIGATSGELLIKNGKKSLIASFLIVTSFMIVVYGAIGFVASLAIILNISMILSLMILSGSTLSLAGIAGLVLTIGMVVDSNVLIFERMREELLKNKNAHISSIQIGFDRALTTIIDSNITTIIAAILLFWLGDSNIKGFAITLIYGIAISFFTAVFFTKVIIQNFQNRILNYSFLLSKIFAR